ncbi:MAG TPA: AAA family ATPase, partial [Coriobacteriia bacterium]
MRAISETLARTRAGTGRLVVVEGDAGIGKSTILRAALERAATTGLRSLHATGSELEDMYPYGLAIALFEPLLRDPGLPRDLLFRGPAAAAALIFDGVSQPSGAGPGDPFATIHSLYWLTLNALEAGPLLLAVDDAQWADAASLRFFHYLGQRASELPLALVLAFRTGEVATDERVVRELRTDQAALQLRPAPLSEAAVGAVLAAFGQDVDPELRRACWEASGGNPFYVTELGREMLRGDKPHGLRAGMSTSTVVPERIARFIEARVAHLDRQAQRFSEAVAILGDEATLRRAATLARLTEDEAGDVTRQLAGAAILRSTGSLGFAHPIVRNAVYRLIPGVIRARLHREAGLLLH